MRRAIEKSREVGFWLSASAVLARKPPEGTVTANVLAHGTGGLNIDATRIGTSTERVPTPCGATDQIFGKYGAQHEGMSGLNPNVGRWPANVLLDEIAAAELDAQAGHLKAGGASRFFYVAKPGRSERDLGCEDPPPKTGGEATDREDGSAGVGNPRAGAGRTGGARNFHPTVKPVALMRYLVKLVTPPGGVVLDPFAGSGTTGIAARLEGRPFLGIEREPEYLQIAQARITGATP